MTFVSKVMSQFGDKFFFYSNVGLKNGVSLSLFSFHFFVMTFLRSSADPDDDAPKVL